MWPRILGFLALALIVFWIIDQPVSASDTVNSILAKLEIVGTSIVIFVSRLF